MIGNHLKRVREAKNWSITKLAEESKVSKGYLSQLETGEADRPSLEITQKLADALGVTVADLLGTGIVRAKLDVEVPASLKRFAEQMKAKDAELTEGDIQQLALYKWRGKAPRSAEDWELLFLTLKRITR